MLNNWAQSWKPNLAAARLGFENKRTVIGSGESPVSSTCQIPNLRNLYGELGLQPRSGTFVEIGAYDGESFSNTAFLADQGWRGLYIEPIPVYCAKTRWRHIFNRVTTEPCAISSEAGRANILMMDALTSLSELARESYLQISWARERAEAANKVEVRTKRMTEVLARRRIPKDLELMVIDVEGAEELIVTQLVESDWRPKVLIVELCDLHPDFRSSVAMQESASRSRHALLDAGYREHWADAINTVFAY